MYRNISTCTIIQIEHIIYNIQMYTAVEIAVAETLS